MNKIYIKDIKNYFNKEINLDAWVDNIRDLQYVQFVILRDSTGKVQMTIEKNENNLNLNNLISSLSLESTLSIDCKVMENEKVKLMIENVNDKITEKRKELSEDSSLLL